MYRTGTSLYLHGISTPRGSRPAAPIAMSVAGQKFSAPPARRRSRWLSVYQGLRPAACSSGVMYPIHCVFCCQGPQEIQRVFPGGRYAFRRSPENVPLYIPYIFWAKPGGLTQIFFKKLLKSSQSPLDALSDRSFFAAFCMGNLRFRHAKEIIGNNPRALLMRQSKQTLIKQLPHTALLQQFFRQ